MSLINLAIRTCLKRALIGRTQAEERVYDSKVTPIAEIVEGDRRPIIVVATDDDQVMSPSWALDADARELDVVVEMVVADAVRVEVQTPQGTIEALDLQLPHTDAGLEFTLDLMQRRIERALAEPGEPWAELFRQFSGEPTKKLKRRGGDTQKGVKYAARQLVFTVKPRAEPAYGQAPNVLWTRFLDQMRTDAELAPLAEAVSAEIVGKALPSWRVLQAALGWTDGAVRNLGPAPVDPAETGEAPVLTQASLDADLVRMEAPDAPFAAETRTIAAGPRALFEVPR